MEHMNEGLELIAKKLELCGLKVKPHMTFAVNGEIVPTYRLGDNVRHAVHQGSVIDLTGAHMAVKGEGYFAGESKKAMSSLRVLKDIGDHCAFEGFINIGQVTEGDEPWYFACVFGGWIPAGVLDPSSGFIVVDKNIYKRITKSPKNRRALRGIDALNPAHYFILDPIPSFCEGNHMKMQSEAYSILADYQERQRDVQLELPNSRFTVSDMYAVQKVLDCHKLMSNQWQSFTRGCDQYIAIMGDINSNKSLFSKVEKFQEASRKIHEARLASPYECIFIGLAYEVLMSSRDLFERIFHKKNKTGADNRREYGMPLCDKKRWNAFSDLFLLFYSARHLKELYECGSQPAMLTSDVEVVRLWCRMNKSDLTMKSIADYFSLGILTEECRRLIPLEAIPYTFADNI